MNQSNRLLVALALLLATLATACSSTAEVSATDQAAQASQAADAPASQSDAASVPAADPGPAPALETTPLDYAQISAEPSNTALNPIPCQLTGPVVAAFADNREIPLRFINGNSCRWEDGLFKTIDVHFRDVSEIDVAERRRLHGSQDTLVDQAGPGSDAATYLKDDGTTERYFFVQDDRAVFLVVQAQPSPTDTELRAIADEIAGLVGSAVDDERRWTAAGETGQDPMCSVWSNEALAQLFDGTSAIASSTRGSAKGCSWLVEGPDTVGHEVNLSLDPFDSIEIYTRNGGNSVAIGDQAAALTETGVFGTLRQVAFVADGNALTLTVDSPTHADLADILATNVASRLG